MMKRAPGFSPLRLATRLSSVLPSAPRPTRCNSSFALSCAHVPSAEIYCWQTGRFAAAGVLVFSKRTVMPDFRCPFTSTSGRRNV